MLNQLLGVPATRNIRGIPTEVALGTPDGMPQTCALTLDNVTTIRTALLTTRITRLSEDRMRDVCAALTPATSC